jgi:cytochrome P450
LIELCRHPDLQERVRAELFASFPVEDPTYEDLTNGAPLLDGLVHETLRLHPPVLEMWRTVRSYLQYCSRSNHHHSSDFALRTYDLMQRTTD